MPMIGDDWVTTTRYTALREEWKTARRDGATTADWADWSARALGPETVGELAAKRQAEYEQANQRAIADQDRAIAADRRKEREALEKAAASSSYAQSMGWTP